MAIRTASFACKLAPSLMQHHWRQLHARRHVITGMIHLRSHDSHPRQHPADRASVWLTLALIIQHRAIWVQAIARPDTVPRQWWGSMQNREATRRCPRAADCGMCCVWSRRVNCAPSHALLHLTVQAYHASTNKWPHVGALRCQGMAHSCLPAFRRWRRRPMGRRERAARVAVTAVATSGLQLSLVIRETSRYEEKNAELRNVYIHVRETHVQYNVICAPSQASC